MNRVFAVALVGMAVGTTGAGTLQLAPPFTKGMVLQRDRTVPVWGRTAPGAAVSVEFGGETVRTVGGKDGAWRVDLPPQAASKTPRKLTVKADGETRVVEDVLTGEVWLCSGQSNMHMPIALRQPRYGDGHGAMVAQVTRKPFIRYAEAPCGGGWHALTPDFLRSGWKCALPVHYALELYAQIDVPIGIVVAASGGSNIDSWNPANGPKAGLYHAAIARLAPFGLRGVIWYQGESNVHESWLYTRKLHELYDGWSKAFGNPNLRFDLVQIAPYAYGADMNGLKDREFARFQEAQMKFADEEPNASVTVINDLGDLRDIHPNNKILVAKRLALHALKRDYGFSDIEADSPTPAEATVVSNRVRIVFDHAKDLYVYNAERTLEAAFELCGADGVWTKAQIVNFAKTGWAQFGNIDGNTVELEAPGVLQPIKVRHAFTSPWKGCLYNQVNLPCSTFLRSLPFTRMNETYRPQFHFTTPSGWINDPNGLVWKDGVWHLCYQHNREKADWGPMMFWGHAVSTDLVRWLDRGDVISPVNGQACYSGSSAVDHENTAGFGAGAIVSMFTRTGSGSDLAWSTDGETWNLYEKNPALPRLACTHRDPMIVFHKPSGKWVLVIYTEKENVYGVTFFTSPDLKSWKEVADIRGDPRGKKPVGVWGKDRDWLFECPNFVEVPVAGTSERRWVLFDASCNYAVVDFDGEQFKIAEGPYESLPTREKLYYAGQTFSNAPDGRCVWMAWYHLNIPHPTLFTQLMSVPCDLALMQTPGGLRLRRTPSKELETLRMGSAKPLEEIEGDVLEVSLDCVVVSGAKAAISLRGVDLVYDGASKTLACAGETIDWPLQDGRFRARVFIDRAGFEIFSEDGLITFPRRVVCNPKDRKLVASPATGVTDVRHRAWCLAR
ncbi:MAG TPA: sialate O-acetylesterase [Kiritimatiellia bacterium]|nr:sialate O-acetylesterase [Kiritimatiellia bacterium]